MIYATIIWFDGTHTAIAFPEGTSPGTIRMTLDMFMETLSIVTVIKGRY